MDFEATIHKLVKNEVEPLAQKLSNIEAILERASSSGALENIKDFSDYNTIHPEGLTVKQSCEILGGICYSTFQIKYAALIPKVIWRGKLNRYRASDVYREAHILSSMKVNN